MSRWRLVWLVLDLSRFFLEEIVESQFLVGQIFLNVVKPIHPQNDICCVGAINGGFSTATTVQRLALAPAHRAPSGSGLETAGCEKLLAQQSQMGDFSGGLMVI